jgi:hypothetical protein
MEIPDTRYAVTRDGAYLAYRRLGHGTIDMLVQFDWMGNVDTLIDVEPSTRALWREVASYARVIFYDRRGTGLSSRNVSPPNLETAVADTQVVLDAVGSQRPAWQDTPDLRGTRVADGQGSRCRLRPLFQRSRRARAQRCPRPLEALRGLKRDWLKRAASACHDYTESACHSSSDSTRSVTRTVG